MYKTDNTDIFHSNMSVYISLKGHKGAFDISVGCVYYVCILPYFRTTFSVKLTYFR